MSDGRLTDAELKAIRERDAEARRRSRLPTFEGFLPLTFGDRDVHDLLSHVTALTADLAAAEGERDGLRLLVTDLASPEGDGREAQARCYCAGVEWERARCAALLRLTAGDWRRHMPQTATGEEGRRVAAVADALDDAARELEKTP